MPGKIFTKRIRVYGIVQGVGFRPFVARAARAAGLSGTVANKGSYVEIIVQGTEEEIAALRRALDADAPERAAILKVDEREIKYDEVCPSFEIIESEKDEGKIFVSPDIAICEKCKKELFDPADRRYLHPFINCTACGPRLTILDAMPYDRERTSMKHFPMCPECAAEYNDPATRRYDAQPVCCNECGPVVYLWTKDDDPGESAGEDIIGASGRDAITGARKLLAEGAIIAIKGIGGFHLACDAADSQAVERLRAIKPRPMKPFAVMAKDMETARRECVVEPGQEDILDGHQKPIILLKKRAGGMICDAVSPDNPYIGLMLPYAPLQLLLFNYDDGIKTPDVLVMTSGNVSGAPICRDDESVRREILRMCDAVLSHNRNILIRADDTVMDFYGGKPYMIRRSRGYAPLPVMYTPAEGEGSTLAIGGELKNTFCLSSGELFYLSPYVGDMADIRTVEALRETVHRMMELLEIQPERVVCDMHPSYNTVVVAEGFARELDVPLIKIQHHYAHILSCMAENDCDGEVIGISFDGTGYGTDGNIWGGEILKCSRDGFERIDHITPFPQAGGDLAAKEGWRVAASMIHALEKAGLPGVGFDGAQIAGQLKICTSEEYRMISAQADAGINTVTSTSVGRLFDAVSAVLGIRRVSTFEGEASTALMYAAMRYEESTGGAGESGEEMGVLALCQSSTTSALFTDILRRRKEGEDADRLAYYFHAGLADWITNAASDACGKTGIDTVALSGGVFQNRLLLSLCEQQLQEAGFKVLTHSLVPPNDGGIALGQAVFDGVD